MQFGIVLFCLLGSTSGLIFKSRSRKALGKSLIPREKYLNGLPACAPGTTVEKAGFRCQACKTKNHPNLVTIHEKGNQKCIMKGTHAPDAPVLTLVDTKSLPEEICMSGEHHKSGEDEDGYSWETDATGHGTTCENKYTAYIWKTHNSSEIQPWMKAISQGFNAPETFQAIHPFNYKTQNGGDHFVATVWPKAGACTPQNRCGLYIHLHALFEVQTPGLVFCGNIPKYVTNDPKCYNKLRSVVLIPQLGKNFNVENWNPDDAQGESLGMDTVTRVKEAYDNFLFPLVEKFLQDHRDVLDFDRVHIGGGSSGGNGAMYAGLRRPDIFSIVVANDPCASGFLSHKEDLQMINDMPPMGKRRLHTVIIGRGDDSDVRSICRPDDKQFNMDTVSELAKKVPTYVRLYNGLGHGTWGHTFNQWPALHDVLIAGTAADI